MLKSAMLLGALLILTLDLKLAPGPNPTILSYSVSFVKSYNGSSAFWKQKYVLQFEKNDFASSNAGCR
jgi:hypothetical protein